MAQADNPQSTAEMISPAMTAYYSNRPLMWRNLVLIMVLNLGWYVVFNVVNPLIQLRLNQSGIGEQTLGWLGAINGWAYSYLVMYFAWKSDRTVTRFGRRIPYLLLTAPTIIISIVLFPLIDSKWILIGLCLLQMLAMDIKSATIPLLQIDCMPRRMLGRVGVPSWLITAVFAFFSMRYAMRLSESSEKLPYFLAGAALTATTLLGGFLIKEPPMKASASGKFRPWSTMKIAWKDRRAILLMCAVTMSQSFSATYALWIWLYAQNVMHLSRSETAQAISWSFLASMVISPPFAWLVDRVSPYKLVPLLIPVGASTVWFLSHAVDATGLIPVACLGISLMTIYSAGDIMIYRHVHPADVGSFTSTNSCLRGLYNGILAILTGYIIQKGSGYSAALMLALGLTTLGIVLLFVYRYLMQRQISPTCPSAVEAAHT